MLFYRTVIYPFLYELRSKTALNSVPTSQENTLCHPYKGQMLNIAYKNCSFSLEESYETHK